MKSRYTPNESNGTAVSNALFFGNNHISTKTLVLIFPNCPIVFINAKLLTSFLFSDSRTLSRLAAPSARGNFWMSLNEPGEAGVVGGAAVAGILLERLRMA